MRKSKKYKKVKNSPHGSLKKIRRSSKLNAIVAAVFGLTVAFVGYNLMTTRAAVTWPTVPPAQICGNQSILGGGPTTAPAGAIVVPAGNNNNLTPNWVTNGFSTPNKTFWFAPGVHTLGTGEFDQISPGNNSIFVGAPGAIIDGQRAN